jgi:hypothetical protein
MLHGWSLAMTIVLATCLIVPPRAFADEDPVFHLKFKDGTIEPVVTTVPANTRLKLVLTNDGVTPVEFESIELRKEKVIGPGVTTFIIIRRLDEGEHSFFDDFHPGAPKAKLVATEDF